MDTQDTAAPQGDSARAVDTSLEGVLARRMATKQEQDKASPGAAEEADAPGAAEPPAEPVEETETGDEPVTPEGDEPAEPEEQPEPKAHGNQRVVMEDGSEQTVGSLKKAFGKLQEIERSQPELLTLRQDVEARQAHIAQQQQQLEQVYPLVQGLLEQSIPPAPTEELFENDPFEAQRQERLHLKALRQRDDLASRIQQLEQQALIAWNNEQSARLLQVNPDLRDQEKAHAFGREFHDLARAWGFSDEEVAKAKLDHRLVHNSVLDRRDALKWRAAQAAQSRTVEKTRGVVPVQQPGTRPAPGAQQAVQIKQLEQIARRTGSIDDVHALHMARLSSATKR